MERLLTRNLVESLAGFEAKGRPVTSVYLGFELSREHRRAALAHLKDLVGKNWDKILNGRPREEKSAIKNDVNAFLQFLEKMPKVEVSGLAMYSCSQAGFFETIGVDLPFEPQLVVADRPAVAPLVAALDEFKRIAVCLVDRRGARLYEYFMGRMKEVGVFSDDVPGRVRVGGWLGYEESRISRHVHEHESFHLKNIADILFEQFKLRGFDWLFLGVRQELRDEVERALHTYVHERLKGYIDADVTASSDEVKKLTYKKAERLKAEENRSLAQRLVDAAASGAKAVTGIKSVLDALNRGSVATLLVREGFSAKGRLCENCGTLGLRRTSCNVCQTAMTPQDNIAGKAEMAAFGQGAVVKHVKTESALDPYEGIGAFVRFGQKKR